MGHMKAIEMERESLRSLFIDWLAVASTLHHEHGYTTLEAIEAAKAITLTEPKVDQLTAVRTVETTRIQVPMSEEFVKYHRPLDDGERWELELENWLFDPANRDDYATTDGIAVYTATEQDAAKHELRNMGDNEAKAVFNNTVLDDDHDWLIGEIEIDEC